MERIGRRVVKSERPRRAWLLTLGTQPHPEDERSLSDEKQRERGQTSSKSGLRITHIGQVLLLGGGLPFLAPSGAEAAVGLEVLDDLPVSIGRLAGRFDGPESSAGRADLSMTESDGVFLDRNGRGAEGGLSGRRSEACRGRSRRRAGRPG